MKIRLETIEHFSTTVPLSSICFVEEEELEDLLVRELWKPELFKEYKTAKEAEMRAKMAESGRLVEMRAKMADNCRSLEMRAKTAESGRSVEIRAKMAESGRSVEMRAKMAESSRSVEMRAKMAESDSLVDNLDNNSVMVDPDPHSYRF